MEDAAVDFIHNILQNGDQPLDVASPALPEGKLFHLFLSHSSADRVKVDRLREVLESAPYNLRCCYDERNFEPGDGILQNIQLAIEKSACTCFFLSPNFVQSMWCKYEQELANLLSLEGKSKVIPILLDQCTMPNALKFINYVDASLDEDIVAQKIVTAVKTDVKEYQPIGFPKIEAGLKKVNDMYQQNGCQVIMHNNSDGTICMTDTIKVVLKDMGLEEANFDKMEKCLALISRQTQTHLKSLFTCSGLLAYMVLTSLLCLTFVMLNVRLICLKMIYMTPETMMRLSFIGQLIMSIIPLCLYIPFYKSKGEKGKTLYQINWKIMCELKCFFTLSISWRKNPVVTIIKYDATECLAYLHGILEAEGTPTEDMEHMLKDVVSSYSERLANGMLPQSRNIRHKVQNHKICLCQAFDQNRLLNETRLRDCFRQLVCHLRSWTLKVPKKETSDQTDDRDVLLEMNHDEVV